MTHETEGSQIRLISDCCQVLAHGHPESPSGDPTRCSKCGKECGTDVLVSWKEYSRLLKSQTEKVKLNKCLETIKELLEICSHDWEPVSADGLSTDYQCKKCGANKTEDNPRPKENWN